MSEINVCLFVTHHILFDTCKCYIWHSCQRQSIQLFFSRKWFSFWKYNVATVNVSHCHSPDINTQKLVNFANSVENVLPEIFILFSFNLKLPIFVLHETRSRYLIYNPLVVLDLLLSSYQNIRT